MAPSWKRSLSLLVFTLVVGISGSAFAKRRIDPPQEREHHGQKGRVSAPEFDGKATGSAAALLIGGVLVLADRRRRSAA